jgi:hypothetical protein
MKARPSDRAFIAAEKDQNASLVRLQCKQPDHQEDCCEQHETGEADAGEDGARARAMGRGPDREHECNARKHKHAHDDASSVLAMRILLVIMKILKRYYIDCRPCQAPGCVPDPPTWYRRA